MGVSVVGECVLPACLVLPSFRFFDLSHALGTDYSFSPEALLTSSSSSSSSSSALSSSSPAADSSGSGSGGGGSGGGGGSRKNSCVRILYAYGRLSQLLRAAGVSHNGSTDTTTTTTTTNNNHAARADAGANSVVGGASAAGAVADDGSDDGDDDGDYSVLERELLLHVTAFPEVVDAVGSSCVVAAAVVLPFST
jgi:hypothetical protein